MGLCLLLCLLGGAVVWCTYACESECLPRRETIVLATAAWAARVYARVQVRMPPMWRCWRRFGYKCVDVSGTGRG